MEKKNKINLDINTRQIKIFEKYYNVDEENKIVSFTLYYEKASEILDTNTGNPLMPQFSNEVLQKINSLIEKAPFGYKVEINFEINDYEGYDPKLIIESFNDTLELNQYCARKAKQKKQLIASNLILVGIILLFIMVISKVGNWFGDNLKTEIASEVINIAAWVFIWEAVTMLFLEYSEQNIFALRIKKRVSQIKMTKKGVDTPLAFEQSEQIFGNWEDEGRIKLLGKLFLLLSSFAFLFMAFFSLYRFYLSVIDEAFEINNLALYIIVAIISIILYILAGIGGISLYTGKNKKISKFVGPYTIFITISIILSIILSAILNKTDLIYQSISSIVIDIMYVIGYLINTKSNKK